MRLMAGTVSARSDVAMVSSNEVLLSGFDVGSVHRATPDTACGLAETAVTGCREPVAHPAVPVTRGGNNISCDPRLGPLTRR